MGRPPSNGGPSFRFNHVEVGEMEALLQSHSYAVPGREILEALAQKFSESPERSGKVEVSVKQVWNWFQNRRYALRARAGKDGQMDMSSAPLNNPSPARNVVPQAAPQPLPTSSITTRIMPQVPHSIPATAVQSVAGNASDNSQMEFEAKSARDGAWYDVASFLSHRTLENGDLEAQVRFAGFGPEEDEWVNILKHVRQRSLPCESSECVAVLPGDLILCFQEGKEQALYFDAHVLDAQRRRHDVRGCRCRFLVRYDHDQSEEIVPLRKICRRPETDYRLQQLHSASTNSIAPKTGLDPQAIVNTVKANAPARTMPKPPKAEEESAESKVPPSKITESGNAVKVGNSNPSSGVVEITTVAAGESKTIPESGNAVTVENSNPSGAVMEMTTVAAGESNPSMQQQVLE